MASERTAVAFFMPAEPGERFCIVYLPAEGVKLRGGVIFVPPFAEEMHKARRMTAMQARELAAVGFAVLQFDYYGCGDSSGEFGDAHIDLWRADVRAAIEWMRSHGYEPLCLWGLRFGTLLAVDAARNADSGIDRLLLWHPVVRGDAHLSQFLRVSVAADLLTHGGRRDGTLSLRKRLASGETVEVGGYEISPTLAAGMDELRLDWPAPVVRAVEWFEVSANASEAELAPAGRSTVDRWRERGIGIAARVVTGAPFWATVEITDCPALIEATTQILAT